MLDYVGDLADYIGLHRYVGNRTDDTADYLAVTASIDRQIEEMDAACRFIQANTGARSGPISALMNGMSGTRAARWTARASTHRI